MITPVSPWWTPDRHRDRRPFLIARARIKSAIRAWFEAEGFIEVDTACLQVSPGNETHLHAFATELVGTDLARRRLYLDTSPEFAMKKLLAAGEQAIFTFAPAFRNRERGAWHSPEFTMLEWYRASAPYHRLWSDCAELMRIAARITQAPVWRSTCNVTGSDVAGCDVTGDCDRIEVDRAFAAYAGIDLAATYGADTVDVAGLAGQAAAAGIKTAPDDTWSDIFSRVLTERIEPRLGHDRPTILCEYPAHEAALARRAADKPAVAERFELYVAGIELANGFGELTDAGEQRRRLEAQMSEKARIYGERYPIDEEFLAALAIMPPAAGCAMGFERLVMLATGATDIEQTMWTPVASR